MGRDNEDCITGYVTDCRQEERAENVRTILQEVVDHMEKERSEAELKETLREVVNQAKMVYDLSIEAGFDTRYAFALATEFFNSVLF